MLSAHEKNEKKERLKTKKKNYSNNSNRNKTETTSKLKFANPAQRTKNGRTHTNIHTYFRHVCLCAALLYFFFKADIYNVMCTTITYMPHRKTH